MIKKMFWLIPIAAIIGFAMWSNDPLNDVASFIIAGNIPGTDSSIGLWSTLGLSIALLWLVWVGVKNTRLQLLADTAKIVQREKAQAKSNESSPQEFDSSKRSVIAAPNLG